MDLPWTPGFFHGPRFCKIELRNTLFIFGRKNGRLLLFLLFIAIHPIFLLIEALITLKRWQYPRSRTTSCGPPMDLPWTSHGPSMDPMDLPCTSLEPPVDLPWTSHGPQVSSMDPDFVKLSSEILYLFLAEKMVVCCCFCCLLQFIRFFY